MSPIISASIVAGSILLDLPSLFLIYAIVMKSPQKMKFIRPFLLKMVVSSVFGGRSSDSIRIKGSEAFLGVRKKVRIGMGVRRKVNTKVGVGEISEKN